MERREPKEQKRREWDGPNSASGATHVSSDGGEVVDGKEIWNRSGEKNAKRGRGRPEKRSTPDVSNDEWKAGE